ncbi:MAG: T9SS type A sorting domain-containing protein, partial [Flavobacteriales bacterium]|nr:T9SS type A sorting domain-containing protein [Flavobacteriales bacterium]
ASAFYYGLGLDGTFARRNDWWRLEVPIGIEETDPVSTFSIFPIPANDGISVQLHPAIGASELIVTTMDGRTVLRDRISATHTLLDLSMMANGSYLLTVNTETGSATQHFVVQR